jgi:hypothetical protein
MRDDGAVVLDIELVPDVGIPELPRLGLATILPAGMENVTYFGRGPGENYRDRNTGSPLGRYQTTVDQMYFPYVLPQEFGNRSDIRWAALTDDQGTGLLARVTPAMEFSAHHFALDNLTAAKHTHELTRVDQVHLYLDTQVMGMGSASCGPGTLEPYRIPPSRARWQTVLRVLSDWP